MAATVEAVLALEPGPRAVLVSGDLADGCDTASYARVLELLAPLQLPIFVAAGNHDDRATMREAYGLPGAGAEPIRYSAAVGELRLVVCDTRVGGSDAGRLDAEHREWLAAELEAEPEWPTIVAMHHPPILTGLDALDQIGLPADDRAGLASVLAANPQVARVVCGHVHRAVFGTLGGCGVVICPSTHAQAALEIGMPEFKFGGDPPGFALHAWVGDQLASHIQPVEPANQGD